MLERMIYSIGRKMNRMINRKVKAKKICSSVKCQISLVWLSNFSSVTFSQDTFSLHKFKLVIVSVFASCVFGLASTSAMAQADASRAIPIIVSYLLDDQSACPIVRPTTTVTLSTPITSQAELDALAGVSRINGDLVIENLSIAAPDFSPLDSLVDVTGNVSFFGASLSTVEGFGCLASIGNNLDIIGNPSLESVTGFSMLESVGGSIQVSDSVALTSFDGFGSLTSVGQNLIIDELDLLTSLPSFGALTSIGQNFQITENPSLEAFEGFISLAMVIGDLRIMDNQILNQIPGFDSLSSVGSTLALSGNSLLASFTSFNDIQSVGALTISGNDALVEVSTFDALNSVTNNFVIEGNALLSALTGFSQLNTSDIQGGITVNDNPALDCLAPTPTFSPVSESIGNLVNCATSTMISPSVSPNIGIEDAEIDFDPISGGGVTLGTTQSSITIDDQSGSVGGVTVDLNLTHTFVGDLTITLSNGTTDVILIDQTIDDQNDLDPGSCSANNIDTRLDDASLNSAEAGCLGLGDLDEAFPLTDYIPLNSLSAFTGDNVNGTWVLTITDNAPGDDGVLSSWGLNIEIPRSSQ